MRRRSLVIALVLAVVAAGVALALALGGDDDEERAATRETVPASTTETSSTPTTETVPRPPRRQDPQDVRAVEAAVTTLIEATEQGDGPRACGVIAGARGEDLEACAAAAGIDLRALPTSDEFSIDRLRVRQSGVAEARLSNGVTVFLRRMGGAWKVTRVQPAAP